jgi:hypothetical protein
MDKNGCAINRHFQVSRVFYKSGRILPYRIRIRIFATMIISKAIYKWNDLIKLI